MKYYLTYFRAVLMFSDRAIIRYVSSIVKYVIVGLFVLEYYICIRYKCEYRIERWFDALKNYFSLHFFSFYVSCLELGDPDRFFLSQSRRLPLLQMVSNKNLFWPELRFFLRLILCLVLCLSYLCLVLCSLLCLS